MPRVHRLLSGSLRRTGVQCVSQRPRHPSHAFLQLFVHCSPNILLCRVDAFLSFELEAGPKLPIELAYPAEMDQSLTGLPRLRALDADKRGGDGKGLL